MRLARLLLFVWSVTQMLCADDLPKWKIFIANSSCSDYTWGFDEAQTRRAFADVVKAHLDEMNRDGTDRYNLSITQEALMFLEYYPERKAELVRRIQEGRISIGGFLNNNLWGFQSVESEIRSLYAARRMEEEWGVSVRVAQHIEEPAMPWGAASILAGSGFRWLMVPYLDYDSSFKQLTNPPLFEWRGPDGSAIRVLMDNWASQKANYVQGKYLLSDTSRIESEWLPHYGAPGDHYPLRIIAALGTHGDNSPTTGTQAKGFADAINSYNARTDKAATLVNATLPEIATEFDKLEAKQHFLPTLTGDFGISWDAWPVTLAKYAADMRSGERSLLATEAMLARVAQDDPDLGKRSAAQHRLAEWNLTMLADHAWNGADDANRKVNAGLRHKWSEQLRQIDGQLEQQAWLAAGFRTSPDALTMFNSLSFRRSALVRAEVTGKDAYVDGVPSQTIEEDGHSFLYFVEPQIPAFSFSAVRVKSGVSRSVTELRASDSELESPIYRLRVDPQTGGIASVVDKRSGKDLVSPGKALGQTIFFNGKEHQLQQVHSQLLANGPVLARLKVSGSVEGMDVSNTITLYAQLDRVDFDIQIHKSVTKEEQRVIQVFPLAGQERIETTGAVIRPALDLLPGADPNRFVVQGFVDVSEGDGGVTLAPLDAFLMRRDLGTVTFEALGNDQNYKESTQDQNGVTYFRFRYVLHSHQGPYDRARAFAWSRDVANPLLVRMGTVATNVLENASVNLDADRAFATAFKLADGQGDVLRIWETAGRTEPITIKVPGYRRVVLTDLIERDLKPSPLWTAKSRWILPEMGLRV
jgi:alpha-mannosidase